MPDSSIIEQEMENALKDDKVQSSGRLGPIIERRFRDICEADAEILWDDVDEEVREVEYARERKGKIDHQRKLRRTFAALALAMGPVMAAAGILYLFLSSTGRSQAVYIAVIQIGNGLLLSLAGLYFLIRYRPDTRWKRARLAQDRYSSAQEALRDALRQEVLVPRLRHLVNKATPSFSKIFSFDDASGLSEIFNPRFEVSTEALDRVNRVVSSIDGGSIGVAGPRGVGKTTLLHAATSNAEGSRSRPIRVEVSAPVSYDAMQFIQHIYIRLCMAVLGQDHDFGRVTACEQSPPSLRRFWLGLCTVFIAIAAGIAHVVTGNMSIGLGTFYLAFGFCGSVALVIWKTGRATIFRAAGPGTSNRTLPIKEQAEEKLKHLRFQQAQTSDTSLSLKIPIIEGKSTSGETWTRHDSTHPETVRSFRDFIQRVAKECGRVFIVIDEMDKMEDGVHASQFLNDIKGIFGIEGCYFLLSVSTDALLSFKRRGMPARDAIDSSFDDVIQLPYLNFRETRGVIERRTLGIPVPFIALAHAMSGGLARDAIRMMRKMPTIWPDGGSELAEVARYIVALDVREKIDAYRYLPVANPGDGGVNWLAEIVDSIALGSSGELVAAASELAVLAQGKPGRERVAEASTLACYLYFAATIVDYFSADNLGALDSQERSVVDTLGICRQELAVAPALSWNRINELRRSLGYSYSPIDSFANVERLLRQHSPLRVRAGRLGIGRFADLCTGRISWPQPRPFRGQLPG